MSARVKVVVVPAEGGYQLRLVTPGVVQTYAQVFPSKAAARRAGRSLLALAAS